MRLLIVSGQEQYVWRKPGLDCLDFAARFDCVQSLLGVWPESSQPKIQDFAPRLGQNIFAMSSPFCVFSLRAVKPERTCEVCYLKNYFEKFPDISKPGISKLCEPNMVSRSNAKSCLWPKSDLWMASQCDHIKIGARSYQLAHLWDVYISFLGPVRKMINKFKTLSRTLTISS